VIETSAVLVSEPGSSLDLTTTLSVKNTGERTIRVDLTRARVSVDGQPFAVCKQGAGTEASDLITQLDKGAAGEVKVTCRDIAKPIQKVEFKFHASGTGADGEIRVGFLGLGERP
jgi:archaellum component FlaG (FlaF/FlaG flagellin family)